MRHNPQDPKILATQDALSKAAQAAYMEPQITYSQLMQNAPNEQKARLEEFVKAHSAEAGIER
jgi:hypothetical protein